MISVVAAVVADRKSYRKIALWSMLTVWFGALIYLMFLYRLPGGYRRIVLNAFHMYRSAGRKLVLTNQSLRQILFNILLFIPLGAILFCLTHQWWIAIAVGIEISVLAEGLQYVTYLGWADIDDVISNGIGVVVGVGICRLLKKAASTGNRTKK